MYLILDVSGNVASFYVQNDGIDMLILDKRIVE